MANDPAFLFYPGDYLRDTQCLSENSQVAYDRIMCEHMRNICITQQQLDFFTKRLSDDEKKELSMILQPINGGFHIPWVTDSITKRREYSESRRKNRTGSVPKQKKKISKSYDSHMENENVIENEDYKYKDESEQKISVEEKLSALDDLYLDQQRIKWQHVNFDFEVNAFMEKVRGSPDHYKNHDTGGIRLAFQSQLRNAKSKQNGLGKKADEIISRREAFARRHGSGAGS